LYPAIQQIIKTGRVKQIQMRQMQLTIGSIKSITDKNVTKVFINTHETIQVRLNKERDDKAELADSVSF
jgi:hypothetical protein